MIWERQVGAPEHSGRVAFGSGMAGTLCSDFSNGLQPGQICQQYICAILWSRPLQELNGVMIR
jgi:hypothetical protein